MFVSNKKNIAKGGASNFTGIDRVVFNEENRNTLLKQIENINYEDVDKNKLGFYLTRLPFYIAAMGDSENRSLKDIFFKIRKLSTYHKDEFTKSAQDNGEQIHQVENNELEWQVDSAPAPAPRLIPDEPSLNVSPVPISVPWVPGAPPPPSSSSN